jgi:putrescine transport system ATP-binding protein
VKHYVGHGITGTEGMQVSVALRPEKIALSRARPEAEHNLVQGEVKEIAYFGSFTVYHLKLGSGVVLKVSRANTERHSDEEYTWGDRIWAHWTPSSQVVLTQ